MLAVKVVVAAEIRAVRDELKSTKSEEVAVCISYSVPAPLPLAVQLTVMEVILTVVAVEVPGTLAEMAVCTVAPLEIDEKLPA